MQSTGIGYGKTILFGEHFVVYGLPAIASAISDHTIATVEKAGPGTGITLIDNRPEIRGYKETKKGEIAREIEALSKHFKLDERKSPLKITLSGGLECASGIGASAALASSIARAIGQHFSLNLTNEQVNEAAYAAETAGSGTPSGIDNTCSTYGCMLVFEKNMQGGSNKIELLAVKKPLDIVLASTGITQETKGVVDEVRAQKENDPKKFDAIFSEYRKVLDEAVPALKNGDKRKVGALMDRNQELLRKINVSCPEIEKIIAIARSNGALGAKLTGTGRGGLVICLAENKAAQERIAKALEKAGYGARKTSLGGE
ncbi:MAG: mevalonate kinase [Candidatus Diapherotrites archaeon]|uniref:Mevalonate kinase n=1 Tax=Candidatus Iainarchaeum sp. TaxID=3101447 RepID=A0A8T3YM95_9ARCH|nr:mevalonate kinase [Candidatus Diapherotrites archaeon]